MHAQGWYLREQRLSRVEGNPLYSVALALELCSGRRAEPRDGGRDSAKERTRNEERCGSHKQRKTVAHRTFVSICIVGERRGW